MIAINSISSIHFINAISIIYCNSSIADNDNKFIIIYDSNYLRFIMICRNIQYPLRTSPALHQ